MANIQVDNFMIFYLVLAIALLSLVLTGFIANWNERSSKRKGVPIPSEQGDR